MVCVGQHLPSLFSVVLTEEPVINKIPNLKKVKKSSLNLRKKNIQLFRILMSKVRLFRTGQSFRQHNLHKVG